MPSRRSFVLWFLLLSLWLSGATPARGEAQALTLQQVLQEALTASPELQQGLSSLREARLRVTQAYLTLQPTATISSSYTRVLAPTAASSDGSFTFINELFGVPVTSSSPQLDVYDGRMSIRQVIYTFGRVRWSALAARLAVKQEAQEYRSALESLLQRTETRYRAALLAEARVGIARSRLEKRKQLVELARKLYREGEVAGFDIVQYRAALSRAERELSDELTQRELAMTQVLLLMGRPPGQPVGLEEVPPHAAPPEGFQDSLSQALQRRPEVAALRWAVAAAKARVGAARSSSDPTIEARTDALIENRRGEDWSAGLLLTIPFLDGGAARLERRIAQEAVEQTRQRLVVAERAVTEDVISAWQRMTGLWRALEFAARTRDDARDALRIAERRYEEGESSSLEVLQAHDSLIEAEAALAREQTGYELAWVDWRRAVSGDYPVPIPDALRVDWELPEPQNTAPGAPQRGSSAP